MDRPSQTPGIAKSEWYFVHALAAYAILTVVLLFGLLVLFTATGHPIQIPALLRGIAGIGVIAIFWFWIRMLVDFFRERPSTHPVAWGWALFLGCYLGGIAYFFLVWRPRNQLDAT
jgi:hypothetical protein